MHTGLSQVTVLLVLKEERGRGPNSYLSFWHFPDPSSGVNSPGSASLYVHSLFTSHCPPPLPVLHKYELVAAQPGWDPLLPTAAHPWAHRR
jgi:hypothetical protein